MFKEKNLELIEDRQQMNKMIEDFIIKKASKKKSDAYFGSWMWKKVAFSTRRN